MIGAKKDHAWSFVADGLKSPATGVAVAEFPYVPPDEYDFRIEFTSVRDKQVVNQFLARRDRAFSFIHGTPSGIGTCGLEMIAGKSITENATGIKRPAITLQKRYIWIARVRNNQVTIEVDGAEVVRWKTDYSDLSLDHVKWKQWTNARRNRALLAIGADRSEIIFHKAEVVEISGQGKFTRPDDPAAKKAEELRK